MAKYCQVCNKKIILFEKRKYGILDDFLKLTDVKFDASNLCNECYLAKVGKELENIKDEKEDSMREFAVFEQLKDMRKNGMIICPECKNNKNLGISMNYVSNKTNISITCENCQHKWLYNKGVKNE